MLRVQEARNLPAHEATVGGSRRKPRMVDLAAIEAFDRDDCIERWRQMFGVAPPKYTSLEFMRKAIAYEMQVKAFGGLSNAVQKALKASLKPVQREVETRRDAGGEAYARRTEATESYAKPDGGIERPASDKCQTISRNNGGSGDNTQTTITGRGSIDSSEGHPIKGMMKRSVSTKPASVTKPSVLSIRAGTHLVREWNGRTYQVETLEKGFRLDGKTYRSLSAIAKKITGAHWSGPRFFGLES